MFARIKLGPALSCVLLAFACNPSLEISNNTAQEALCTDGTTRFAVIGDYGKDGPDEERVAALVKSWNPEFIITTGDNNYPTGAAEDVDANIAKHYGDFIHFDAAYHGAYKGAGPGENRFFPVLGNHDWETPDAQPYLDTFDLPGNKRYYTFSWGPVDGFGLDSDPREPDGVAARSVQGKWLQSALAASSAPWKLVYMHHSPYSSGDEGSNNWMQWPFQAWGASVVLAGHDHDYERIILGGFPYFVIGTGGAPLKRFKDKHQVKGTEVDVKYPTSHGAVLVEATQTTLVFQFFNDAGELIDSYTLSA